LAGPDYPSFFLPSVSTTATSTAAPGPSASKPLSLGVIFLTLYIDLIGFSIIFPFGPDLLQHYLGLEGHSGLLGWILAQTNAAAHLLGNEQHLPVVLFGGVVSSIFSVLQFLFAPIWGGLSDRIGRRRVLLFTVAGTALSYLVWAASGSFWLFVLSRVIGGAFGGNLSVATAAVADVTSREERSRAMGLVGAAFGLGLVTGPTLGAITAHYNLLVAHPGLARFGINPFSVPALIALAMSLLNLVWISRRFRETLDRSVRVETAETRVRHPLHAIFALQNKAVRRANLVAFVFSVAFVAMEMTLTFLAADRFGYTARQNGWLLGYLGVCSIVTQGVLVRRLLKVVEETRILGWGLLFSAAGLLWIGWASAPWMLYGALTLSSLGSGLVNPATTGLISLYCGPAEQGRVLGIFRSLGSLSRAITPVAAGLVFWGFGPRGPYVTYGACAVLSLGAFAISTTLPKPHK